MVRDWRARTIASIRVSDSSLDWDLEHTLTLCFETRVREIVRFRASFTDFQLGSLEVSFLLLLLSCTRSHGSSRSPSPWSMASRSCCGLEPKTEANLQANV